MGGDSTRDGKGEIERKLEVFIDTAFKRFNLDSNTDQMNRQQIAEMMQELMLKHGHGNAWNRADFDQTYDLFEEDEASDPSAGGLDKNEFLCLIKRIAQL